MTKSSFRRYTNLAAALHLLSNRCITLLDPSTWDDKNDAFFMSEYKRIRGAKTVLALCFAEREETYHHWQVFSRGSDGVCIEFDLEKIKAAFAATASLRHRSIKYDLLSNVQRMDEVNIEDLPFLKRWPYGDESEYRVVHVDMHEEKSFQDFPIRLEWISRITLSPWLNPALVPAVKTTMKSLPGCSGLEVYQSTLIDNKNWKRLAGRTVAPPEVP